MRCCHFPSCKGAAHDSKRLEGQPIHSAPIFIPSSHSIPYTIQTSRIGVYFLFFQFSAVFSASGIKRGRGGGKPICWEILSSEFRIENGIHYSPFSILFDRVMSKRVLKEIGRYLQVLNRAGFHVARCAPQKGRLKDEDARSRLLKLCPGTNGKRR